MRFMTGFRLFFVVAMFTAGVSELISSELFTTPASQLTLSAITGSIAVVAGKITGAFI